MDDVDTVKVKKDGFMNHVFNFDTETKSNMMNIIQYLVLAIIPMSFYTHFVNNMMSEYDESKSNFEVTVEVLGHLLLTLLGLIFFLNTTYVQGSWEHYDDTYIKGRISDTITKGYIFNKFKRIFKPIKI